MGVNQPASREGVVERRAESADKRVREAIVTPRGESATDALDAAREAMALELIHDWSCENLGELVRLMVCSPRAWPRDRQGRTAPPFDLRAN